MCVAISFEFCETFILAAGTFALLMLLCPVACREMIDVGQAHGIFRAG